MADKDIDPSQPSNSFPPDGQDQPETAKTRHGHRVKPKDIIITVEEPSFEDGEVHQEVPNKDLAPPKKKPVKKKAASQEATKSKKQKRSETPPAPYQPKGPSKEDRAAAGSSRPKGNPRVVSEEEQEGEYSDDYDHYSRDSRDRYREDSRSRYDYYPRDRYFRDRDRDREERYREERYREDRYWSRFRDDSRSRYDPYHRDPRDRYREFSRPRYDFHRYDHREEYDTRHSSPRQNAHHSREEQENGLSEENLREIQRMINEARVRGSPDPPPGPHQGPLSFQDSVAAHSSAPKDVLCRLSKIYGDKIKHVRDSITNEFSYVYDFQVPRDNSFWATPEVSLPLDEHGTFKILEAPSINRNWSYSAEPQLEEVVEGVVYPPGPKPERSMDALAKPAVPGRCADKDIDIFLSSKPLTKYANNHAETGSGRHLEVDPEVFPGHRFLSCDNENLIPSLEHKSRLLARDGFAALDMVRAQEDKTKLLFSNWNSPGVWHQEKGVLTNEDGSLVVPENGATLAESVTKEDLLQELYNKADLSKLVIRNLEHLTKLAIASHAESKLFMREIVLFNALPSDSNLQLIESVRNTQLSSPLLFGPIPNSFRDKIKSFHVNGVFKPFAPPSEIRFQAPVKKHTFRNRSKARRRPQVKQPFFPQAARPFKRGRGGNFVVRPAKNQNRGRKSYSSLPPQPRNQQASRDRSRGRGRGRGRGGETSKRGRGKGHR